MEDISEYQFPSTPGMPLFALSPERVNKLPNLQPSPSVPNLAAKPDFSQSLLGDSTFSRQNDEALFRLTGGSPADKNDAAGFGPPKHWRASGDVQGIVARFNSLDIKDKIDERIKKSEAALKRAQMGREEAEAEVKKLREEDRQLKKEADESKDRERRVAKRLDVVMEDLHRSKETQAHAQTLYEKEIRRARKEAFKASSTMVKLQEELKAARNTLNVLQSDLDLEKMKVRKREQETFNAQYQLVGVQEELSKAQAQIKVVEEERDALKTSLKEEEVARIAAEGRIALPSPKADDDEFTSPKKQTPPLIRTQTPDREPSRLVVELEQLRAELEEYKLVKEKAEAQVDFMKMECQFGSCSCRVAESRGAVYVHVETFADEVRHVSAKYAGLFTPPDSVMVDTVDEARHEAAQKDEHQRAATDAPSVDLKRLDTPLEEPPAVVQQPKDEMVVPSSPEVFRKPYRKEPNPQHFAEPIGVEDVRQARSPTKEPVTHDSERTDAAFDHGRRKSFALVARIKRAASQLNHHDSATPLELETDETLYNETSILMSPQHAPTPHTPQTAGWRTVTTTTKVPLADPTTPAIDYRAFASPNITREEAIQQLRERRGRARSEARTGAADGTMTPRRDISAPEARTQGTPRIVSRGRMALV